MEKNKGLARRIASGTWKNIKRITKAGILAGLVSGILMFEEQNYGPLQKHIGESLIETHAQDYTLTEETPWLQEKLAGLKLPPIEKKLKEAYFGRQNNPTLTLVDKNDNVIFNSRNTSLKSDFNDISPLFIDALIAAEDENFRKHHGWDLYSASYAVFSNIGRKVLPGEYRLRGASTLSIQLADLLLPDDSNWVKTKIKEWVYSCEIENKLSKDEILRHYVNLVNFGQDVQGPIIGVESASRRYFGKSARQLDLIEAASLVSMINKPTRYGTNSFKEVVIKKTKKGKSYTGLLLRDFYVLDRMFDSGFIDRKEYVKGRRRLHYRDLDFDRDNYGNKYRDAEAYEYTSAVLKRLNTLLEDSDMSKLSQVVVRTHYDPEIQKVARTAFKEQLKRIRKDYEKPDLLNGSVVVLDTKKHCVLGLVGGLGLEEKDYLNRATITYTTPGSTFKPFVLLSALQNGYSLQDKIADVERSYIEKGMAQPYKPKNFRNKRTNREYTLEEATMKSVNSVFVELGYQLMHIERDIVKDLANQFGFGIERYNFSTSIGTEEVSSLRMAGAISVFANGGYNNKNEFDDSNTDFIKYIMLKSRDGPAQQIIPSSFSIKVIQDPEKYTDMNNTLGKIASSRGTAPRAKIEGYSVRGKTGTGLSSFCFAGYESALERLVFVGFASDNLQKTGPLSSRYTGGRYAAPVFKKIMEHVVENSYKVDAGSI